MAFPLHIGWLVDTGEIITTDDGFPVSIWELEVDGNEEIMSDWAKHFRNHYCDDSELAQLVAGTGLSNSDFLTQIKFPDAAIKPGPSTRSGDFGEILVADFVQYIMGYWCPRDGRYDNRDNRNSPTQGTDIIGFRFVNVVPGDPDDELFLLESKAGLRPTNKNRLQQAIDGSIKDGIREAMSLNAIKQRLLRLHPDDALRVQRFQQENDRPFRRANGAVAVLETEVLGKMSIEESTTAHHPNVANLKLVVIKGTSMMDLVTELYERAANEA